MPLSYQGEAPTSVVHLINRIPSTTIKFQILFQALGKAIIARTVLNLPLHVFGCVAFVHCYKHQCNKLFTRALRCIFHEDSMYFGYVTHQKRYQCYHPLTQRMFVTLDIVFHEGSIYFFSEPKLLGSTKKKFRLQTCFPKEGEYLESGLYVITWI